MCGDWPRFAGTAVHLDLFLSGDVKNILSTEALGFMMEHEDTDTFYERFLALR